ncbi:hypothetical protein TcasGA2_TC007064 [Tribolium castaneum]|uniref:Uncharacterized protein n=1 Tax=Tribolium castaneum TaxID=7070 RepID=D2A1R1_TRICA|nr:hypothetical protein TcasGA2_TC007064 [Tribolium castaneum]
MRRASNGQALCSWASSEVPHHRRGCARLGLSACRRQEAHGQVSRREALQLLAGPEAVTHITTFGPVVGIRHENSGALSFPQGPTFKIRWTSYPSG